MQRKGSGKSIKGAGFFLPLLLLCMAPAIYTTGISSIWLGVGSFLQFIFSMKTERSFPESQQAGRNAA